MPPDSTVSTSMRAMFRAPLSEPTCTNVRQLSSTASTSCVAMSTFALVYDISQPEEAVEHTHRLMDLEAQPERAEDPDVE